eukprot:1141602-Pelagomonas_calceolata.AAC.3
MPVQFWANSGKFWANSGKFNSGQTACSVLGKLWQVQFWAKPVQFWANCLFSSGQTQIYTYTDVECISELFS